jgi:hypothetical protein
MNHGYANLNTTTHGHTYNVAVYKEDADHVFYDHRKKKLITESCVEQCGEEEDTR